MPHELHIGMLEPAEPARVDPRMRTLFAVAAPPVLASIGAFAAVASCAPIKARAQIGMSRDCSFMVVVRLENELYPTTTGLAKGNELD